MPKRTIFEIVVDALKESLEPIGIMVDADIYHAKLTLTEVLDRNRNVRWVMQIYTTGPLYGTYREVEERIDRALAEQQSGLVTRFENEDDFLSSLDE